jgi:TPR repeat protein
VASDPSGGGRYDEAITWYQQAADAGSATALRRLGDLAADGIGGLTPNQAIEYYEQALAMGDGEVGPRIARTILQGSPDQSQVARAVELTAGPAQAGNPNGQYWHGVAQRFAGNYDESLDWLISAYRGGEVDAISQMATTATEGAAHGLDIEGKFAELISQGGNCERAPWYTMLGDLAARGAVPSEKAGDYYREAMQLGDARAAAAMGRLHVTGVGLAQPDLAAAHVYLTMAQEAGVAGLDGNLSNLDLLMSDEERARTTEIAPELRGQMESVCP